MKWENMKPNEIWNALLSAPRIAGPWQSSDQWRVPMRVRYDGRRNVIVFTRADGHPDKWGAHDLQGMFWIICGGSDKVVDAPEQVDAELRARGYLLTENVPEPKPPKPMRAFTTVTR